jgi:tetratricopeptide (TPR) repeat protein
MLLPSRKPLAEAGLIIAILLIGASATLAVRNVPSIGQVYEAARSGQLERAETMTREVLRAYPNSARAHYVMAQILAAEGRGAEARDYLTQAKRLKPGLPFANPRSVAILEQRIERETRPSMAHPGVHWIAWWWIAVGAVVIFLVARAFRRSWVPRDYGSRELSTGDPGVRTSTPSPAYAPSPSYGGGLLSSVLAGLGFGAAAAAGQRAMERLLGGGQAEASDESRAEQWPPASDDFGGDAFGVQPGDSSTAGWEDSGDQTSAGADLSDDFAADDSTDGGWDDSSGGGGEMDV